MRKFWLTAYPPEIQRELMGLGHHNLAGIVPSGLAVMALVWWVAGDAAPRGGLWLWLSFSLSVRVIAVVLWLRFRKPIRQPDPDPSVVRQWMWAHSLALVILGTSVGLLGALFVPAAAVAQSVPLAMHNLILTMAFLGAVAYSAAGTGPADLPAFLVSLACASAVMIASVPRGFGEFAGPVIGLCAVFTALMTWVAFKSHRLLLDTIGLRLANERLAADNAQAAAQARQANLDKSDFLAAASHDLRQPVHALVLLVEALRQRRSAARPADQPVPPAEQAQDALIASIGEAAQAIRHLFGGLMDLSRLESGREQPMPAPLQPAALLRQVLARHAEQAAQQGLRLRLHVSPLAESAWVSTDRVMLERCLLNLLANALRYTRHGGVLLSLRLRGRAGASHGEGAGPADLVLGVHDTGPGIAAADQARIFMPYVQLGNAQRDRRQGLGLGLAIVRQCADRLGLALTLRSRPGRGSAFTLRLPAVLRCPPPEVPQAEADGSATAGADAATAPADGGLPPGALAGRRVLLIDDDPMVREAMRNLLAIWGVDLRLAHHGQDPALAELDQCGWVPEALLCDHRLPGDQQGLSLLDALQDRWPDCSAVLVTGEPSERVHALAEEAGYPVLYKPVSPVLLASTLRALLRASRAPATAAATAVAREDDHAHPHR